MDTESGVEAREEGQQAILSEPLLQELEEKQLNLQSSNELLWESKATFFSRLSKLISISMPISATFLLVYLATVIGLMFAGHIKIDGEHQQYILAGVSLGSMFGNVTGFSILTGLSSAIETLASQYNGASDFKRVGYIFQRSVAILSFVCIPIILVWVFTEEILLFLGQDPLPSAVAGDIVRVRILSLPFEVYNTSFEKYLQAQGVVRPAMWSSICEIFVLIIFNFLFIYVLKLSYVWLSVSFVLADCCSMIVMTTLAFQYAEVRRTFSGVWSNESLKGWKQFFSLGVPGALMICLEWWCFELLVLLAGVIGTEYAAAEAIVYQTIALAYMIPLGLSIATSSLVGNALGAGNPKYARQIAHSALCLITATEACLGLLIYFGRELWVKAYTSDQTVVKLASDALPIVAGFILLDGLCCISAGILRGSGRQYFGAVVNFFAYYPFGLPFSYFLAFKLNLDIQGLMVGIGTANGIQSLIFLLYVLLVKWEKNTTIEQYSRQTSSRTFSRSYQ